MEKLIELLREFDDENWNAVHIENYIYAQDHMIISKRYGFIKWLVDNDKIDNDKLEVAYENEEDLYIEWDVCRDYRIILMLLAISDTPIEDLISYLK